MIELLKNYMIAGAGLTFGAIVVIGGLQGIGKAINYVIGLVV